ncbi:MAG TPA: hypothetical protein VHO25_12690 [Polyangiaceae bacterium]|nr:hypothetical protein [Polyangiaceae bacterium]
MRRLLLLFGLVVCSCTCGKPSVPPLVGVRTWLRALQNEDIKGISNMSSIPFTYLETWPIKQCQRVVTEQSDVSAWFACVRKNEDLLFASLNYDENLHFERGLSRAADSMIELTKRVNRPGRWVKVWIQGDGYGHSMLLLVTDTGSVSACVINIEFEKG